MRSLHEGESAVRSVRVPDELWARANRAAREQGTTVAKHIREALEALAATGAASVESLEKK